MANTKTTHPELIAVTGAGGFIGSQIIPDLRADGFTVRPISGLRSNNLVLPDQLDDLLKGVHTVVHCAGSPTGPSCSDLQATVSFQADAKALNASLINSCKRQGVKRLIFLSSAKVRISDPLRDVYAITKLETEEMFSNASDESFEALSLRIPMVYGPTPKPNFAMLAKLARLKLPLPLKSIGNQKSLLSITNLSRVISELIKTPSWPSGPLDVADPSMHSTPDLLRLLAKAQGNTNLKLVHFPTRLLAFAAKLVGKKAQFYSLAGSLVIYTKPLEDALPNLELLTTGEAINLYFGRETS